MKNKFLSMLLVIAIVMGVFTGICLVTNAEKGESPNLLDMYSYNPNFDDGIKPWRTSGSGAEIDVCDEDSSDGDGFCAKVTKRSTNFSNLRLMNAEAGKIFNEQGSGQYYYAFSVKCATKGTSLKLKPIFQFVYGGSSTSSPDAVGKWLEGTAGGKGTEVTADEWVRIETVIDFELELDGKALGEAIMYSIQVDFTKNVNAFDLLFDDIVLIKKDNWVNVTPEPDVEAPVQTRVEDVNRSEKTGIGAIYYHMWYETVENWWNYDNNYINSTGNNSAQDARCLAPNKHHYRLPFFTKMNTSVTQSSKINGSVSTGVPEFPEFTEEIWKQEMEYAVEAGIDFMAYLWNRPKKLGEMAYQYHIKTKGLDGKIKMCAILQSGDQDLNAMANAMTEDYWYTVDGMPVVYIYDAKNVATEDLIANIRKKVAMAQYSKNGEVGKPVYIIGMGMNSYSAAVGVTSRGIDAVGWYAVGASSAVNDDVKAQWKANGISDDAKTIKSVSFARLAECGLEIMKDVAKVWEKGYASVSPIITLGRNNLPRIENPVTWSMGSDGNLPYSGTYAEDPTPEEMTKNVLDVLNWNKQEGFACNTVIMYCWNEYNEGGWCCPTIAVDKDGNVLKNADGTNKINREYLDAVKKGVALYREHEAEDEIYDENGNKIGDVEPTPVTTSKPKVTNTPSATDELQNDEGDVQNNKGNGWVVWTIVAGVVAAAAATVVVILLKKKKAVNTDNAE